ncbi:MAG TPA: ATP-dependent zinc metalloprotease FtsH [Caldilineae bacterium]|nr:ATP-dependent zinc metalloprotease FtsH [Caldilineae bacterium]
MPDRSKDRGRANRRRQIWYSVGYLIASTLILLALNLWLLAPFRPEPAPYSRFLDALSEGTITHAAIGADEVTWTEGKGEETRTFRANRVPGVDDAEIIERLHEIGAEFTGVPPSTFWSSLLTWGLPFLLLLGFWGWSVQRLPGATQALSFGRSRAKIWDESDVKVTFKDVAGVDEAVEELREVVDFLKHPEKYTALGARIPKGVLLVGPPGTGKTLLARATAGEAGVPFFSISGADFVEMFVGVGAARVRDLFRQAREKAPCIVFIDEIDTIGRSRAGARSPVSNEEREQTLNQLLVEMDGFDSSAGVIIMAATNRPDVLDPALLRPGRFDRQIVVDKPDLNGREAILRVHTRNVKLAPDVDLRVIAARTPGFAGAELANVVNEAALLAVRRGHQQVTMEDLDDAIDRVMAGLERKNRALNERERAIVAHHEMGHALLGMLLPHADPVHKVSIVPRGAAALGVTIQVPLEDRYLLTEAELRDRMTVVLGGRAAEEIVFGQVSTGPADDLQRATELARRMVTQFGMSEDLGPIALEAPPEGFLGEGDHQIPHNYSDETARRIDAAVRHIVEENYARAKTLLQRHKEALITLANELLQKEVIEGEELAKRLEAMGIHRLEAEKSWETR